MQVITVRFQFYCKRSLIKYWKKVSLINYQSKIIKNSTCFPTDQKLLSLIQTIYYLKFRRYHFTKLEVFMIF